MFERRLRNLGIAGLLFFLLFTGRLFTMQVLRADHYREKAEELARGRVRLPGRRGTIVDRNGVVLAEDRLQWDLLVRLDQIEEKGHECEGCGKPTFLREGKRPRRCRECMRTRFKALPDRDSSALAAVLEESAEEFGKRIAWAEKRLGIAVEARIEYLSRVYGTADRRDIERGHRGWQWEIAKDVPARVVQEVALNPDRHHGFSIGAVYRRAYPGGDVVRPLIGVVSGVREEERKEFRDKGLTWPEIYRLRFGRYGLERTLEDRLAGTDGSRVEIRDVRGRVKEVLSEVPPEDGETVRLSLDLGLQMGVVDSLKRVVKASEGTGAAFVAMDPRTGEVIVLADWQEPDTNPDPKKRRGRVRHLGMTGLVPGSVFKVVTAVGALQAGTLKPEQTFDCGESWHRFRCHEKGGHGRITVVPALEVSCNQFFAWAAGDLGLMGFDLWAHRLGFGERTGIGLGSEQAGLVPNDAWKEDRYRENPDYWKDPRIQPGELWQMGFGKGSLLVTPLQVARLMAILGNGGRFVDASLVRGGGGMRERVVEPAPLSVVRRGLEAVVDSGTGARIGIGGFRAAGKTGTAELVRKTKRHMAWFAGYAPREAPTVAFACVITETGKYGADAAGPVVRDFLSAYLGE